MAQKLRADVVINSLEKLERRIDERFPVSGMRAAVGEIVDVAHKTEKRAKSKRSVGFADRFALAILILILILLTTLVFVPVFPSAFKAVLPTWLTAFPERSVFEAGFTFFDFLEVFSSVALLVAGPIWYFRASATRARRKRVFKHLHELRSYAHVIDMHQLTKDPVAFSPSATRTASSPERTMTPYQLARYLGYCSEALALTGKLAALYGEFTEDPEVSSAVNDIETLTAGMVRKIWQKIMVLDNETAMAPEFVRKNS